MRTEIFFTTIEAEGEGLDPKKLVSVPSNVLLIVKRPYFHCGTFLLNVH